MAIQSERGREEIERLAAAIDVPVFGHGAIGPSAARRFFDRESLERLADRDPSMRPPLLVDAQTHILWREDGYREPSPWALKFMQGALNTLHACRPGSAATLADLGRLHWFEETFLRSDVDVTFLNSFGMKAHCDGVDLFPPREAAYVRSLAPDRVRVLGTLDPSEPLSATLDSLAYQCEVLQIDGLKLFPPSHGGDGWRLDDEKVTYPLFEVLRRYGIKNVCAHKGPAGPEAEGHRVFQQEYCRPGDLVRAAADHPDLNFINFHAAYPFEDELIEGVRRTGAKNVYAELGLLAFVMLADPARFARLLGNLLAALGEDHILWGTDSPNTGSPQWQIQLFSVFTLPEALRERFGWPALSRSVKEKIFGLNAARLWGLDPPAIRRAIDHDLVAGIRNGGPRPRLDYRGLYKHAANWHSAQSNGARP